MDEMTDVLKEELFRQAHEAETDLGLMGSALARYCELQGWSREELADWLGISTLSLAALYCEPRPVPVLTTGPQGGRGVFTPEGGVLGLANEYEARSHILIDAFNVGRQPGGRA
jgi:hypothetical protein